MLVVLDFGNSQIKLVRDDGKYLVIPSHVAFPQQHHWDKMLVRAEGIPPEAYVTVNGVNMVIGAEAKSHTIAPLKQGAARYTRELFGHAAMGVIARLLRKSGDVQIFASHAPRDVEFRKDQRAALLGDWEVKVGGKVRHFTVDKVRNFDEPIGGWANTTFTLEGDTYKQTAMGDGRVLVIDVGGLTTDVLGIRPGGTADYGVADSIEIGINRVISDFRSLFKKTNHDLMRRNNNLEDQDIQSAIRYSVMQLGGKQYECHAEVEEVISQLVNDVIDGSRRLAGGFLRWDYILLTGGGGALVYPHIYQQFDDFNPEHVFLAEDLDKMHLANVFGGLKLYRVAQAAGLIK